MRDFGKIFRFRDFQVYRVMRSFCRELKQVSNAAFPIEERFGLLNQLWRAADSVTLNIAEGSGRGSDRDFAHFLNIAHTSLNEVVACLDAASDNRYFADELHDMFLQRAADISCQISALRKAVMTRASRPPTKPHAQCS